jgi:hypothetical protein
MRPAGCSHRKQGCRCVLTQATGHLDRLAASVLGVGAGASRGQIGGEEVVVGLDAVQSRVMTRRTSSACRHGSRARRGSARAGWRFAPLAEVDLPLDSPKSLAGRPNPQAAQRGAAEQTVQRLLSRVAQPPPAGCQWMEHRSHVGCGSSIRPCGHGNQARPARRTQSLEMTERQSSDSDSSTQLSLRLEQSAAPRGPRCDILLRPAHSAPTGDEVSP